MGQSLDWKVRRKEESLVEHINGMFAAAHADPQLFLLSSQTSISFYKQYVVIRSSDLNQSVVLMLYLCNHNNNI